MGSSKTWFSIIRRKLSCSSPQTVTVLHTTTTTATPSFAPEAETKETQDSKAVVIPLTEQDIAAIKIQAVFRGHLARQAFHALKSLVKLQAVVRGVCVRRQARIALHCMHALTRLQVTVRARQLLSMCSDD